MFGDKKSIENSFSKYLDELRNSKKAKGAVKIYTHGQKEVEAYNDKMKNGIPMNDSTLKEIYDICKYFDIDPKKYISKIE